MINAAIQGGKTDQNTANYCRFVIATGKSDQVMTAQKAFNLLIL